MTVRLVERASGFGLTPPIGSIRTFSGLVVMPTSERTCRPVAIDTRAVTTVTATDRPSSASRGGHAHVDLAVQRLRVDSELLGVRTDVGQRDLRGFLTSPLHHDLEVLLRSD